MAEHTIDPALGISDSTASHHEERSAGAGRLHALEADFVGATLGARFRKALADLEGLLYVICGSIPDSYASGRQWWLHDNPRCLWPEQVRRWECGIDGRNELAYGQTAAAGQLFDWAGNPKSPVDTGYFDWSRSDTVLRQWWRTNHDEDFFPVGSVTRAADGVLDGHPDYGDPRSTSEVRISYTPPSAVAGRILAASVVASPGGVIAMVEDAGVWRATLPPQEHGQVVTWYLALSLKAPDETIYEPCGANRTTPPAQAPPPDDPTGDMPGHGHNDQAPGTCYYHRHFDHRHPYMHGLPELLWMYLPAERQCLRKCTGSWQFEPWTNIRPGLINLARFALDWIGARFHHDPRYRGTDNGCCFERPIMWRWSGSNRPALYRAGGKGGPGGVHPLHNHPMEQDAGSPASRRTWRGMPLSFFHLEGERLLGHIAGRIQSPRYGSDESWLSWPSFADFQCQNDDVDFWYPGWMNDHGEARGLRPGDVIDAVHLEEIIAAVEYIKRNGLWFIIDINSTKRTPPDCRPLMPNDRMGTVHEEWSCRRGQLGDPVCDPPSEVVGRHHRYGCGYDCGPVHGLYGNYYGPENERCWNYDTWDGDCAPPNGTEWDYWWKIVPWSAPSSQACCNSPHPSRCPFWEYQDGTYGLIHTDLVESGRCHKGLTARRTCMGREVSSCESDGVKVAATEFEMRCLAAFSSDPDYALLHCYYEPGFPGDPRGITCEYSAQTIGWHGYVCAPKRTQCAPGAGAWDNGAPRWTHEDSEHGNGSGCLTKGRVSCRFLSDPLETPEVVPSMGNAPRRGSRALVCATRSDGAATEVPFSDDPDVKAFLAEVDWAGPATVWVTHVPSCKPEQAVLATPGVIAEIPGLGYWGPYVNGTRSPICTYENYDDPSATLTISRVYCSVDKAWFPLCDGSHAWAAVDLNLDGNGIPQLKDYDLSIRGLDASGAPLLQGGRPVCPDTPNLSDERRLPFGGVRCPCNSGERRARDRGIWDD